MILNKKWKGGKGWFCTKKDGVQRPCGRREHGNKKWKKASAAEAGTWGEDTHRGPSAVPTQSRRYSFPLATY